MTVATENAAFLSEVDRKVHYLQEFKFKPNGGGRPFPAVHDCYVEASLLPATVDMVLETARGDDMVIYPINTNWGFSVGFCVSNIQWPDFPGLPTEERPLLKFLEKQLPPGYGWERLSRTFLSEKNKKKMEIAGLETISPHRSRYEY